ncbi:MAG TPA: hypothetical protein VMY98_01480 [Anaerolineae bacterium]|nr:hypothetical protein [Anaerolineae bacterium]
MPVMGRHRIEFVPPGSGSGESACGPAIVSRDILLSLLWIALSGSVMLALTSRCVAACCGTLEGGTQAVGAPELSVAALSFLSLSARLRIAVPRFLFWGRRFIVALDAIIATIVVLMAELIEGSACRSLTENQGALWDVADSRL